LRRSVRIDEWSSWWRDSAGLHPLNSGNVNSTDFPRESESPSAPDIHRAESLFARRSFALTFVAMAHGEISDYAVAVLPRRLPEINADVWQYPQTSQGRSVAEFGRLTFILPSWREYR
jgi:hypothetical protein